MIARIAENVLPALTGSLPKRPAGYDLFRKSDFMQDYLNLCKD
jgi:hypothetical protein